MEKKSPALGGAGLQRLTYSSVVPCRLPSTWWSLRQPRYWYVLWSMFWVTKCTDPSTKQKFTPPVWFDLAPQVMCQFQILCAGPVAGDPHGRVISSRFTG